MSARAKKEEPQETPQESAASELQPMPPSDMSPTAMSPAAAQPQNVKLDESKLLAGYANFARVTGTPEEVIIDFGLNPEPFGPATRPVDVGQRIILNFFTAKRLLAALQLTIQRHEGAFGVLETDVQRRVQR